MRHILCRVCFMNPHQRQAIFACMVYSHHGDGHCVGPWFPFSLWIRVNTTQSDHPYFFFMNLASYLLLCVMSIARYLLFPEVFYNFSLVVPLFLISLLQSSWPTCCTILEKACFSEHFQSAVPLLLTQRLLSTNAGASEEAGFCIRFGHSGG